MTTSMVPSTLDPSGILLIMKRSTPCLRTCHTSNFRCAETRKWRTGWARAGAWECHQAGLVQIVDLSCAYSWAAAEVLTLLVVERHLLLGYILLAAPLRLQVKWAWALPDHGWRTRELRVVKMAKLFESALASAAGTAAVMDESVCVSSSLAAFTRMSNVPAASVEMSELNYVIRVAEKFVMASSDTPFITHIASLEDDRSAACSDDDAVVSALPGPVRERAGGGRRRWGTA
eukprot:3828742-Pleurochrysis_carterae.AAC.2